MKKYRAELNKYNRQKGTYGNGDKKDASHKNGKISGWGKASPNGWKWTEDKKVAQPLIEALEMYRKERAPDYVPFNFYGSDR